MEKEEERFKIRVEDPISFMRTGLSASESVSI